MPLSKEDRIAFSKKIVEAPYMVAAINKSKAAILVEKDRAQRLDDGHKNLVDAKTFYIDKFQLEFGLIDGNDRSILTESDIQASANFVLGNFFYPNDINNPAPSLAPGIWTKTKPYARNKGVGKFFNEAYGSVTGEVATIATIQAAVTSIQGSYTAIQRVSGQECVVTGTCSLPIYTTQATCLLNGGIWTPGADLIQTNAALQAAVTSLVANVNSLKSILLAEASAIYTADPDPTRQAEATAALNDINNIIIPAIDTWLALADYNTAHGQTTCAGFNAYNPVSLGPTKLQAADIAALTTALGTRSTFNTTRQSQLGGYLGTMTQNLSTGDVTGSGFYFQRWSFLQLRLNMLGGSLLALKGFERALTAQDEQIANVNAGKAAYELVLQCTGFAAPGNGTKYLHVKSSAGFSVGDNVFVTADDQEELIRTIDLIEGNRIRLGQPVPSNYRDQAFGRIYKDLS
jgi:hypothetical protein